MLKKTIAYVCEQENKLAQHKGAVSLLLTALLALLAVVSVATGIYYLATGAYWCGLAIAFFGPGACLGAWFFLRLQTEQTASHARINEALDKLNASMEQQITAGAEQTTQLTKALSAAKAAPKAPARKTPAKRTTRSGGDPSTGS